ncbi:MAG: RluA family pseudouridine synthase [Clostridia bacterium]|nr:RluA family pseudouridine synthase [Clostridia bacterium]
MRTLTINTNDAGQRLDKFLSKAVPTLPTSLMYKLIRTKKIKVNRKRTEHTYFLCEGDTVELFIKEEFFENTVETASLKLTPHIDIIYEDENIILCDKRAGMIVHSDDKESTNTLISHITAYLYQKGEYDPEKENSFAPALCNRIDRNTGGIVIAAKNAQTLRIMNEKIKNRELSKKYLAAVHGTFEEKEGVLKGYLIKDSKTNTVKVFKTQPKNGEAKKIITGYRVVAEKNGLSLLEVDLITGRTHQIRAHMSSIGHPLLGDGKYGVNRDDKQIGYKYQALYSYSLEFCFKGDSGILGYLNERTFKINEDKIWFCREFK